LSETAEVCDSKRKVKTPKGSVWPQTAWLFGKKPIDCHHAIDEELSLFVHIKILLHIASAFLLYCMSGRFSTGFFIAYIYLSVFREKNYTGGAKFNKSTDIPVKIETQ
jgi:hypothetical protein